MQWNESILDGKVAVVTGSARGIGEAIARALAIAGAHVVVADMDLLGAERVVREIRGSNGKAMLAQVHVEDIKQVCDMVTRVVEECGAIDILVNNAGVLRSSTIENIEDSEWNYVVDVNLKGVFNCTKAVLPLMKSRRRGKIVNISSSAGRSTSTFGGAHYTASKAGVLGLTRHTAREAAPFGINVNAVAPGSIETDMVKSVADSGRMKSEERKIPLGRLGVPEDIARLVLFLVSEQSSYIAGATIDINGGDLLILTSRVLVDYP